MDIEQIWKGHALLGESPLWDHENQTLYWVDCTRPAIYRYDPATQKISRWPMPATIGSIARRSQGAFIAAIGNGFAFIELTKDNIIFNMQTTVFPEDARLRMNDGKCDRQGRFWAGTVASDFSNPDGCLYRYDPDGRVTVMEQNVGVSNGLTWSLDNKLMYYTDSLKRTIYQYDFDAQQGTLSNRRIWAKVPEDEGFPDGLTIDSEGYLWSARFEGGKIVRYTPEGKIDREILMPAKRPTSLMFGGPNLNQLFITTCSQDVDEKTPLPSPAGNVFEISLDIKGVPETMFEG